MNVIDVVKKYIPYACDGIFVDLNKSHGSWVVDGEGKERLDMFSQYASQPIGWNDQRLRSQFYRFENVLGIKLANPEFYCREYADFLEIFASITPDFKHRFFIEGGTLGVENALKAAFDYKAQKLGVENTNWLDIIHFKDAFHGRSGYSLSLTNTFDPCKYKRFPKFNWTRVVNPKTIENEDEALFKIEDQIKSVAAIIIEPLFGEGGNIVVSKRFFEELRKICDEYDVMLIFDEVQTGIGLTGKMWAYEHYVKPDMICYGKKVQLGGFACTDKIDEVKNNVFVEKSRINSTWGGNIVDMVRSTILLEIIKKYDLVDNARIMGDYFLNQLKEKIPDHNPRGLGLMIGFDFEDNIKRNEFMVRFNEKVLAIKCGDKSIRFRPHLTIDRDEIDYCIRSIMECL